jgi:hypothetical protein
MKHRALVCAIAFGFVAAGLALPAAAGVIRNAQSSQSWSAWGGDIGVRWNTDLLGTLGIRVASSDQTIPAPRTGTHADSRQHTWFGIRESGGLEFSVRNDSLVRFDGGSLQMRGGYVLRLPDGGSIDLRNVTIRPRASNTKILDFVGADGKSWFYSDRVMFELADHKQTLAVRAADLRIAPALAARIGVPDSANWEVADLAMNNAVYIQGSNPVPDRVCSPYPWPNVEVPGVPGAKYQADLFMQSFSVQPVGCQGCDGPGGSDGIAALAPSSTLRNNIHDGSQQATIPGDPRGTSSALYTANISWKTMFDGDGAPYDNDQHPFLIWNMYRINADGSIVQIGESGVKHAFLTVNGGCADSCHDSYSLGRGCDDTYGSGNNDSPWDMGPRSEIVPAKGIWGRCGSIFDADCNGSQDNDNGNDSWTQRMKVKESQIDPAANPGSTYVFESWYLARDDINIYNSMASEVGTPHYSGGQWSFSGATDYQLGPAIDRWVAPDTTDPNQMNSEMAGANGHVKVAVKVTDMGSGNWRYDYAVMNLDFAHGVIQAPEHGSDPRVISNRGFDRFAVPMPAGAAPTSVSFHDADADGSNDWSGGVTNGQMIWSGNDDNSLDWGTLYSFSVTAHAAPVQGRASFHVAKTGPSLAAYSVKTLVPGS